MSKLEKRVGAIALGVLLASTGTSAVRGLAFLSAPPTDPAWQARLLRLQQIEPLARQRRDTILASLKDGVAGESYGEYEESRSGFETHEFDIAPCGFFFEYQTDIGTKELAYGNVVSVEGSRIRLEIVEDVALEGLPDVPAEFRVFLPE